MSYDYETAAPDRYELLKDFAKYNRREMTESETVLWNALRKIKAGVRFRRQHPIGDYISKGYQVIRIKNEEISNDLNKVVMRIKAEVLNQSNDSPRPLERGRG